MRAPRTRRARFAIAASGLAAVAVLATGCDKFTEPFKDAPRSGMNNGPAEIITQPDGFGNIASKCDGPNRVYSVYHGDSKYGSIAVVANDPRCTK